MIPASIPVELFHSRTGEKFTYNEWVPERVEIDAMENGPTSATIRLRRCRTLPSGRTERISDQVARQVGVSASVTMTVADIYAEADSGYPAPVRAAVLASIIPGIVQAAGGIAVARGVA